MSIVIGKKKEDKQSQGEHTISVKDVHKQHKARRCSQVIPINTLSLNTLMDTGRKLNLKSQRGRKRD